MTLRFRVLISVCLIQALAVVGLYWAADALLLDGHKKLEQAQLEKTHGELRASLRVRDEHG